MSFCFEMFCVACALVGFLAWLGTKEGPPPAAPPPPEVPPPTHAPPTLGRQVAATAATGAIKLAFALLTGDAGHHKRRH